MSSAKSYNHVINHVAISVPSISAAIDFYTHVFGFEVMGSKIHHIKRSEMPEAPIFKIYGDSLQEVKVAHLATGNSVGFEIFEFIDPRAYVSDKPFEYDRGGFFHICVTDADVNGLAEKVVAAGGKRVGVTVDPAGIGSGIMVCYVADPWGNVVEILDIGYDRLATIFGGGSR